MYNKKLGMSILIENSKEGTTENPATVPDQQVTNEVINDTIVSSNDDTIDINTASFKHSNKEGLEGKEKESVDSNSENKSNEFNRANIEALGNQVRLIDSDDEKKLDLFCYVKCGDEDSDLLKQCRGVVFNGDKVVLKAFSYTPEYNHTETEKLREFIPEDTKGCVFFESHEGALVRFFNFDGKWYQSTHRKLNAFRSKWSSNESFGALLKKALEAEVEHNESFKNRLPKGDNILERFQNILDPAKQYIFLIRNNDENRIVCDSPERPILYHVGTLIDGNITTTENVGISIPDKFTFDSLIDIQNFVENIDIKKSQGIICFKDGKIVYKILNKMYQELFKVRGNEPSIKYRYLQIRMNRKYTNMLYNLYPKYNNIFDEYENTLYDIARSIYWQYVQRFIKKRYVTVPKEEFQVIRECHNWHLNDRETNRISIDRVIKVMNKQSPTNLNRMIRRFHTEQTKKGGEGYLNMRDRADSNVNSNINPKKENEEPVINEEN